MSFKNSETQNPAIAEGPRFSGTFYWRIICS